MIDVTADRDSAARPLAPLVARAWHHADPVTVVTADGITVVVRRRVADILVTDEAVSA